VVVMNWGLVPSWTKRGDKPDFFRAFNARSETVRRPHDLRFKPNLIHSDHSCAMVVRIRGSNLGASNPRIKSGCERACDKVHVNLNLKAWRAASQVTSKNFFRRLVNSKRCVAVFEGFYEWVKDSKGQKQPYYIHFKDGRPMLVRYPVRMGFTRKIRIIQALLCTSG
jgi:hypothetical protein